MGASLSLRRELAQPRRMRAGGRIESAPPTFRVGLKALSGR